MPIYPVAFWLRAACSAGCGGNGNSPKAKTGGEPVQQLQFRADVWIDSEKITLFAGTPRRRDSKIRPRSSIRGSARHLRPSRAAKPEKNSSASGSSESGRGRRVRPPSEIWLGHRSRPNLVRRDQFNITQLFKTAEMERQLYRDCEIPNCLAIADGLTLL